MNDALSQFCDAIRAAGLEPPDVIELGKLHRFPGIGKRNGNTAGWCKLFDDGLGGCFGDWSSGFTEHWQAKRDKPFSQSERAAFMRRVEETRKRAEAERQQHYAEAAEKAATIWNTATPANDEHPYLVRKGIKASGARLYQGALVIPVRSGGELHSLQFIAEDGNKRFLSGGRISGGYFSIGTTTGAEALCIAEGFATGSTIHQATNHPVAVAFNAGNLEPVAKAMRERFPKMPLIVCADDDATTEGNPGLTKATEAAHAIGGLLAIPDFGNDRPVGVSDFNDMAVWCGIETVGYTLSSARIPPSPDPESSLVGEYGASVELLRGSDIKPEPISWLWDGWLAAGKMHVFGGAPGTGKTTIALALAATVTTGGRWPDGTRSPDGNVVIWSGEDDPADTLIPRLTLSGADLFRVYFIADIREGNERRSFDPARDMEPLRRKLAEIGGVRLLIVDPIVSAIAGDSHKNAEVRRGLQPLADLAASMRCALLGITHFTKGTGGRDPVERITGSLAFGALARVVLVAAKHQEEEDGRTVRLFCRAKSNIGPDDGGFEYDLHQAELQNHPGIFSSSALWGDAVEGAARELLATADATGEDAEGGTMADAKRFLSELLADGPLPTKTIKADAEGAGCSWATVKRAKKALGIEAFKEGGYFGEGKQRWMWKLPPDELKGIKKSEEAQQNMQGPFREIDPLQQSGDVIEVEI